MCAGHYGAHEFRCPLYAQAAPMSAVISAQEQARITADQARASGGVKAPDGPGSPPGRAERDAKVDPPHYSRLNPQPITVIESWGLNFNLGNVIKYVARAGSKLGQSYGDDLAKAADYLRREMARTDPMRSNK